MMTKITHTHVMTEMDIFSSQRTVSDNCMLAETYLRGPSYLPYDDDDTEGLAS